MMYKYKKKYKNKLEKGDGRYQNVVLKTTATKKRIFLSFVI